MAKKKKIGVDDGHGLAPLTPGKRTPFIKSIGRFIRKTNLTKPSRYCLLKNWNATDLIRSQRRRPISIHHCITAVKTANDAKCDLFISIHYNAFDGTFEGRNPEGFSAHIDPSGGESEKFAR